MLPLSDTDSDLHGVRILLTYLLKQCLKSAWCTPYRANPHSDRLLVISYDAANHGIDNCKWPLGPKQNFHSFHGVTICLVGPVRPKPRLVLGSGPENR